MSSSDSLGGQVFGDKPPPALYQITNLSVSDDDISVVLEPLSTRRDSHTTILSIVTRDVSAEETQTTSRREHRESNSSSSSTALSPLVFKDPGPPVEVANDAPDDSIETIDCDNDLDTTAHISAPLLSSNAIASTASVQSESETAQPQPQSPSRSDSPAPSTTTSHTPLTHKASRASSISSPVGLSSWTAPPSTTTAPRSVSPVRMHEKSHDVSSDFRLRRLRAAKLSRFFGVGLNDLASVLPPPPVPPPHSAPRTLRPTSPVTSHPSTSTDRLVPLSSPGLESPPSECTTTQHSHNKKSADIDDIDEHGDTMDPSKRLSTSVEVAAEVKHTFGFGHRNVKQMDMQDVIHQLRKMR